MPNRQEPKGQLEGVKISLPLLYQVPLEAWDMVKPGSILVAAGSFVGIGAKDWGSKEPGRHLLLIIKISKLRADGLDLIEKKIRENMTLLVMSKGTQG